jgi:hypothetical protein
VTPAPINLNRDSGGSLSIWLLLLGVVSFGLRIIKTKK